MSLLASTLRFCWLALAASILQGCGDKLIRLGDQTAELGGGGAVGSSGASATGGSTMVAGPGGEGGVSGSNAPCPHAQVLASEVLWIGDSWVNDPGTQNSRVRDLARAAGAIGSNDDYTVLAAAAADMAAVAKQYDTRESGATKVKVLIMDGGTWDGIAAQMSGASVPDALDNSASTFRRFLAKVASDGTVEHIVYYLVPELPSVPGVAMLRPQLQKACVDSAVPCHFIDLQPSWSGHPEYTALNGIQSSETGAVVIANLIWTTMQDNCIAQ